MRFETQTPWPAGHYSVNVTLDARSIECSADVPLRCDAPIACPDPDVSLQLSGCALPASNHAITGVDVLRGTPAHVAVEVRSASGVIANASWQPKYQNSSPNGEQCEPKCTGAAGEVLAFQVK